MGPLAVNTAAGQRSVYMVTGRQCLSCAVCAGQVETCVSVPPGACLCVSITSDDIRQCPYATAWYYSWPTTCCFCTGWLLVRCGAYEAHVCAWTVCGVGRFGWHPSVQVLPYQQQAARLGYVHIGHSTVVVISCQQQQCKCCWRFPHTNCTCLEPLSARSHAASQQCRCRDCCAPAVSADVSNCNSTVGLVWGPVLACLGPCLRPCAGMFGIAGFAWRLLQ